MAKQTSLLENAGRALAVYGGWRTLFSSGYLALAVAISLLLWRDYATGRWAEQAIDTLPSIIGFTLAAAAVLTSVGGEAFRERLALVNKDLSEPSPIVEVVYDFIVNIMVQVGAYVFATIFISRPFPRDWLIVLGPPPSQSAAMINGLFGFIGSVWLIYSLVLTIGLAFSLMAVIELYVRDVRRQDKRREAGQNAENS